MHLTSAAGRQRRETASIDLLPILAAQSILLLSATSRYFEKNTEELIQENIQTYTLYPVKG